VLIGRDGREYDIDDSAAPIYGGMVRCWGWYWVFHDVDRNPARWPGSWRTTPPTTPSLAWSTREFERRLQHALASAQQYGAIMRCAI